MLINIICRRTTHSGGGIHWMVESADAVFGRDIKIFVFEAQIALR